jgi:hypothetical protein
MWWLFIEIYRTNSELLLLIPTVYIVITRPFTGFKHVGYYSAFGKSLFTYKRCWIRFSWTIVSKILITQLHTLPVLHFNRCLTNGYCETTGRFNGNSILTIKSTHRSPRAQRVSERTVCEPPVLIFKTSEYYTQCVRISQEPHHEEQVFIQNELNCSNSIHMNVRLPQGNLQSNVL